ncbi:uncharacterized protein LOC108145095 [Drosophila elegans]|uniref:uncharacterized protein LOC108145095 n=1 Tax=Drosophila elegans TaxID=30023 RepID=UPI0007E624D5|nr:uncharacterized protein LOC108145095 [Drosophila elegans]
MRIFIWCVLVFSSTAVARKANAKKLADDPLRTYNQVVRNLIRNWESPVVYLRDRGFLPKNFEDTSRIKPNLDALVQRMERAKRHQAKGKDIVLRIKPTEMGNIKQLKNSARNQRGILTAKGSVLSNLERLEAIDSKMSQSNPRLNEQEGQLLAMKRRLEQLQPGVASLDQPGYRRQINVTPRVKTPVKSAQNYDEILQRMIEKTSPLSKQHSSSQLRASKNAVLNSKFQSAKDDKLLNSAPINLSTYKAFSFLPNSIDKPFIDLTKSSRAENKNQMSTTNFESDLAAPRYLNWDIKNGRLDHYSSAEKEAYLNQLVRVFGQNLDSKGAHQKWG